MGVYHKFRSSASSIWIILQPTQAALNLPITLSTRESWSHDRVIPHVYLMKESLPAWRAYLKTLEALVRKNVRTLPNPLYLYIGANPIAIGS
jgi:hypothetical protein